MLRKRYCRRRADLHRRGAALIKLQSGDFCTEAFFLTSTVTLDSFSVARFAILSFRFVGLASVVDLP